MCRHAHHWERERRDAAAARRTREPAMASPGWGWTADPPPAAAPTPQAADDPADLLIADRDRERVVDLLKRATSDGRLTIDEFGDRVEETYRARTGADLKNVLRQLPYELPRLSTIPPPPAAPHPAGVYPGPPRQDRRRSSPAPVFRPLIMIGVVFAIVALATGGHVLAAWPLLWLLFFVFRRH